MELVAAITGFIGLVAIILKYVLRKKTKTEAAIKLGQEAKDRTNSAIEKIASGEVSSLNEHLDSLLADVDAINRMRSKTKTDPDG